jgi:tetratricopeptide (TPR) repeat protein
MFDIRRLFAARRADRAHPVEVRRALEALRAQRYEEALDLFSLLLQGELTAELRALVSNKRGVALVALGRSEEGCQAFEHALAAQERYAPALVNLGNLMLERGALEDAIERYRAALRVDEDYAVAHLNLGVALKRAGRTAEGVRHLRTAQRLEGRRRS